MKESLMYLTLNRQSMTSIQSKENQLIEACLNNSRKAQRELFDMYYNEMLLVCKRYCYQQQDLEAIVNEGFLAVFTSLKTFGRKSSLKTWMTRIFINKAISYFRKNKTYGDHIVYKGELPQDSGNEFQLEIDDIGFSDEVLKKLSLLNGHERTVLTMYVIEEYSHKEIAELLNFKVVTSRFYLSSAKKKLKEALIATH